MRAIIPLLIAMVAAAAAGCAQKSFRGDDFMTGQYHPSGRDAIRDMLDSVSSISKKSPETFAVEFYVDGTLGDKKYKLLGSAQGDRRRKVMHISFLDFIFRSGIAMFFQEGDDIRIYYPVEKKLYVDRAGTIDLARYGGVSIDYGLLYDIATGTFPIVTDYTVKEGLAANNGTGSILILENKRFYETISFNGKNPDKILFVNKQTRERFEIYVKKIALQGNSVFFANVVVVAQQSRFRLDIHFNRIVLNAPLEVRTLKDVKLPKGVQIIEM
ncbi:MAG: hypothetical protein A2176_01675 [Spirochaetes bacterium RBG_13_51_14]|nr:MAG: hypothetical protein A2176_01675 [Spirochaetes bacterium RBG_13_51_14]